MDFALIGNCQTAALVDRRGRIIWWCFPRFDSDPVFSRLLAGDEEKGFCEVALADLVEVKTQYLRNTAVVETILVDARGGQVRVVDFAPLFDLYGRTYRAPQIMRRIEPIAGLPRITVKVRPTCNYGERVGEISAGSHHIRYISGGDVMRLTTDAPISYIVAETGFPLHRTINLIFGQDDPFRDAIDDTCREFLDRTCDHWREWTRRLNVPFEWQSAVVRAAITLKLCGFEETGASSPRRRRRFRRRRATSRNWDYRYCWLRDAFFVVEALNRLGATHTMESYIHYITTIATDETGTCGRCRASCRSRRSKRGSRPTLKGYLGYGPVRVGNQAAEQVQNDVYGSVVLAATQMFVDERLPRMGDDALFACSRRSARSAQAGAFEPDAGSWEFRGRRASTPIRRRCAGPLAIGWRRSRDGSDSPNARLLGVARRTIRERILGRVERKARRLTGAFGEPDLDASVLLVSPNWAARRPTTRGSSGPARRSGAN